jgi:cytochrome b subunit of formate dehydrogenase
MTKAKAQAPLPAKTYPRFDLVQRVQHLVFMISFTLLGLTGLPQKFPLSPPSLIIFQILGGIETARLIHHASAIVMMIVSLFHVLEVLYRVIVLRTPISMIPWIDDLRHVLHDIAFYLGFKKRKAYYGRYSYVEKAEYLALIWGTLIMGLTGFMMWNPISAVRFLPGEFVPASKAAHGGEAVLAVLAIILWHFYHVHIKHLNLSMFKGTLTQEEMEHEHPAELAALESRKDPAPIPAAVLRRRRAIYAPVAIAILALFSYGFYLFVGYESTALESPPVGETAPVFVPFTPTPIPPTSTPILTFTPEPTASPADEAPVPAPTGPTWEGAIGPFFAENCGACHIEKVSGGLNLSSYAEAAAGGEAGPLYLPGDGAASLLITKFESGEHIYADLSPDGLALLKEWIDSGAPEK